MDADELPIFSLGEELRRFLALPGSGRLVDGRMRPKRAPRAILLGRGVAALALVGFGLVAVLGASACGTEPVGVDTCRRIEKLRCESAPACGLDLKRPPHSGDSAESDVAACIRYYDDQCLHGLRLAAEPARTDVDACANAIINGDCTIVGKPEAHPACSFLVPETPAPAPAADGGADAADAADGG